MAKGSANVIPLRKNDMVETLEAILEMAREGKVQNFIAAGFMTDGNVFTTVSKADVIEHQTLNSYLQAMATTRIIQENLTT